MTSRTSTHPEVSLNLALAVVASSHAPLVLLDGELRVIAASLSFCKAFQIEPAGIQGLPFCELGAGEWDIAQLPTLLKATAAGFAEIQGYEIDLQRPGQQTRRLVLSAHKLDYGNEDQVRVLLAVTDITEARIAEKLKDDLLGERAVLIQELQHRVANSLQIVASILMQTARKVQSDETKTHLVDAHQRVMSVATLQKQLAASTPGDVVLRPYFTALCDSIGASMIVDHNQIKLQVNVDDSISKADVSMSLGLIVTELVINALKHAFPSNRTGKIVVAYSSHGPDWTLSVRDDGVGMPKGADSAKPGLGTSIIQALARQQDAVIGIADANPGTAVSVVHAGSAHSGDDGSRTVASARSISVAVLSARLSLS